ncbi:unnamed protein product [Psylliodes chrysocephalus]|uniref:Putative inorganic phosphate cotransporter n=1 Tax=Psylliodes chrysocephalus TaxID=3402493 RepID=A0A9P0CY07_9CUCU|nr:unnamed protein product [Psylliodes chrysocephala]
MSAAHNDNLKKAPNFFGIRHIQYVMMFICVNISYGTRSILSITIFPMTEDDSTNKQIPNYPEWAPHKNMILSSFFWGYICFQVVAGQFIKKWGPKWFFGGAIFIASLFCALVPLIGAQLGYQGVIACRIITGLMQGFMFPCVHCLLSFWTAFQDRAKIGSFVYAAGPLGNVISLPLSGLISNSKYGWPAVFYLYGVLGMAWSVLYFIVGSDSPAKHKTISMSERQYIEQQHVVADEITESAPTPWKHIFLSAPFWAILVSHCGQNLGFWTLLTEIPSYLNEILLFDLKSNSSLSSLPYLVNWILSLMMGPMADFLITKNYVTTGTSRKIFNSIGMFIPAISLICLTFIDSKNPVAAIFLLTMAVGFNSAVYSGFNVNHIDLSPVHAGTLMALTNSVSNIFSLFSPLIVDMVISVTGYKETQKQLWTFVFCIAAGVYITTGIVYNLFGSGEVQSWNNLEEPQNNKTDEPKKQESTYRTFEDIKMDKMKT